MSRVRKFVEKLRESGFDGENPCRDPRYVDSGTRNAVGPWRLWHLAKLFLNNPPVGQQPMQTFKVNWASSEKKVDSRIRLLIWEAIWILVGAAVIVYSIMVGFRALFLLGLGVVVLSLCIFNTLGIRAATRKTKGELSFQLTETELIGEWTGKREVRIALSEIASLREKFGWLTVLAVNPARKIAIPKDVEGYEFLRAELSKHARISSEPLLSKSLSSGAFLALSSFIVWFLLLASSAVIVVRVASLIALGLLFASSFYILGILKNRRTKFVPWVLVGAAWIAALFLIYLRVFANN